MFKRDSLQSRILTVALTVAMTFTSYPTQGLSEEVAAARDLAATMQATMATTDTNNGDGSGEAAADTAAAATDNTSQQDADAQTQSAPTQATPNASSDEKTPATVKFDANGGMGSMDDVTIEDSTNFNLTLPTSTLTRDGYTFAGWSTTADGKDVKASDGTVSMRAVEVPNSTALDTWKFSWDADGNGTVDPTSETFDLTDCVRDGSLVLYAQWEENSLTVSFDGNGATSGSMNSLTFGWDHETALPECDFARDGYEFTGWSTTPDGSSSATLANSATLLREVASCDTDGDGTTETFDLSSDFDNNGALTLYAQWEATSTDESATTETDQNTDTENGGQATTEETSSDSKSVPATGALTPTTSNADNSLADVRDADHGGADELTVTTSLPFSRILRAAPSSSASDSDSATDPVTGENTWSADGTTIADASVSWVTKDTKDDGNAAHLVVAPTRNNAQSIVARIDVSLTGSHDYAAGDIQIVIPGHIFTGRDGNTKGNLVLPLAENPGTRTEFNWSYNAEDDTYTLTNTRSLRSSQEIMIQAGIENLTPSQLVDEQDSSPFSATVYVRTNKGTLLSRQSNQITAQFDTNETIGSATVSHSDYAWDKVQASDAKIPDSLRGQYPDETNFLVVTWYTYAYHQGNTAYSLGWSSQATDEYNGTVIENGTGTDTTDSWSYDNNTQYRYIKVAYPLSQFQKDTEYTLSNSVTWTMTETDKKNVEGYQPQQVAASSSLTFVWHEPTDQPPSGHFAHRTWGDDNDDAFTMHATINMTPYTWYNRNGHVADLVRGRFGTYTSALNGLTGGSDASVRYEKYMRGYVLPYMLEDGAENTAVENFSRPVTMTLTDGSYGFALQAGNPSYQTLTAGTDYDYSSLVVRIPTTVYKAVAFDASNLPEGNVVYEDGDNVYRGYNDKTHGNTYGVAYVQTTNREDYPDVVIEAQVNGTWKTVQTIHWADVSGDFATVDLSGLGATSWRASVTFNDATKAAAIDTMFVDPVVVLHPTQTVLSLAQEALGGDALPPTCLLQSSDTFAATNDQGSTVYNDPENGVDYLYGYNTNVKATYTDSGTTAKADDPDYNNNLFKLHFNAELVEQSSVTDKVTWQTALDNGDITAETSGTWYDLLPKGASVDLSSVRLRSGDSIQDVRVIDNYKGSGRQLLVVKASLTPNATTYKDPSGTQFYEDRLTLSFDATYDFAAYVDYGASLHNVYAFESDNDHLGNVADYSGELGDISTANNLWTSREATFVNEDEKDLMKDLDPSNTNPSFIYAGSSVTLGKLNAMTTGLKLTVDVNHEGRFTTGLNDLQTSTTDERNAYTGSAYTYRIEATTGTKSQADNIVLFDKVDGYTPTDEDQAAHGDAPDSATWRGSFMGVDTSQLESLGVKPVIYYSTKQNLELAGSRTDTGDYAPGSDADLSNSDVWSTTEPSGPSTITYVAIDCSKAADGTDFILDPSSTISARLTLRAPEGDAAAQAIAQNAHAFNQSFAKMENVDHSSSEVYGTTVQPSNYTKVGLKAFNITVNKQWDDDNNRDGLRPDSVTVHLLSNNTEVEGRQLSGENSWTTTYENLPFDDANGSRINYSVTEDAVSGYVVNVSRPSQTEFTITNRHTPEKISVSGQKTWKGDDEHLADRPTSIQVTLLADGAASQTKTVTAGNAGTWAYSFDNLYKYRDGGTPIVYSVSESGVDDYVPSYSGYDITNTYHPYGDLAISKQVEGATSATAGKKFAFTVSLNAADGGDYADQITYTGPDGTKGTISNGGTIELEAGQTATIEELPKGTTYTVHEADVNGFTASKNDLSGTIKSNRTATAAFTNTYTTSGVASIQATKSLSGRSLEFGQFRYTLTETAVDGADVDPVLVRAANNTESGNVAFGSLRYNNADDGHTYTYVMAETNTHKAGYTYDASTFTVEVTPHDNGNGTMSCAVKYYRGTGAAKVALAAGELPQFNNEYHATGSTTIVAYKSLSGRPLADKEFTFDLYRVDESNGQRNATKISTVQNDANGRIAFDELAYTEADAGKTYTYYAVEEQGKDDSVNYSSEVLAWTVSVQDNGDGTLSETITSVKGEGLFAEDGSLSQDWTPTATTDAPTFHNTLKDGAVSIEKHGYDDEATKNELTDNPNTTFTYDVKVTDADGRPMTDGTVHYEVTDTDVYENSGTDSTTTPETPATPATPAKSSEGTTNPASSLLSGLASLVLPTKAYADENQAITVTYDGNGGTFSNGSTRNLVTYLLSANPVTKYSHTQNVSDDGTQVSNYENNWGNANITGTDRGDTSQAHVVTIPGATKLHVTITYGGESSNYDWVCMWTGSHPSYTAYNNYGTSLTGRLGGGSHTSSSNTKEYDVDGDTVTFAYRSDYSGIGDGYGYYATVTPAMEVASGAYEKPVSSDVTKSFTGWNTKQDGTGTTLAEDAVPSSDTTVYAQWGSALHSGTCGDGVSWQIGADGALVIYPTNGVSGTLSDMSNSYSNYWPWSSYASEITSAQVRSGVHAAGGLAAMFMGLTNLKTVDLAGLDTSNATSLAGMFYDDSSLMAADLSTFKTSNVTSLGDYDGYNTRGMFENCASLVSVDFSGWDTSNVTMMNSMFWNCWSLRNLDVTGFDTSKVTSMGSLFRECHSLVTLDISNFDTSHVTDFGAIIGGCSSLESVDLSNMKMPANLQTTTHFFDGDAKLKSITVSTDFRLSYHNAYLPNPSSTSPYTGRWVQLGGDESTTYTSSSLQNLFRSNRSAKAGTWVWQATTSTIAYNANGGDGSMAPGTFKGGLYTVAQNGFYKSGYNFTGWNTTADGSGTSYQPGAQIAPTGNMTLYAQWQEGNTAQVADGTFTVTIKAGQKITISGLPGGATYTVTERSKSGWTQTSATGASGTVPANGTAESSFTNQYTPGKVSTSFNLTKYLDGKAPADGRFSFKLESYSSATPMPAETTVTNVGSSVSFGPIQYGQVGTYRYKVTEVDTNDPTITYDTHTEPITVKVTHDPDDAGKLIAAVTYDANGPEFDNATTPGSLVISKNVSNSSSTSMPFTFDVLLVAPGGSLVNGAVGNYNFANGHATVTLHNGESVTLPRLTPGTSYTVTETNVPEGYSVASPTGGTVSGTIAANGTSRADFTNSYTASGFASLSAKKTLDGDALADNQFSFQLTDEAGNVLQTATNDAYGNVDFAQIDYATNGTLDGYNAVLGTHRYFVHEVVPGEQGSIVYDSSWYEYDVNVTDTGNGTLATHVSAYQYDPVTQTKGAEVTGGMPTFQNSHKTGSVTLTKKVENATDATGSQQFSFDASFSAGGTYAYSTVGSDGSTVASGTISDGGTLSLADGQTATISGLPVGSTYGFTEQDAQGFSLDGRASSALSGTVTEAGSSALAVNNYSTAGTAALGAAKRVTLNGEDQDVEDGAFNFTLTDITDGRNVGLDIKQNDGSGNVEFASLAYSAKDSGKTFTYQIAELPGGDSRYDYDTSVYTAEVKPTDNGDGTMTCDITYYDAQGNKLDGVPTFVNERKTGSVSLTKHVEGGTRATSGARFDFLVTLSDGGTYTWKSSTGTTGTVSNGDTLTLADNETVTISGVPAGTTYSFVERNLPAGFSQDTEKSHDMAGNVPDGSTAEAVATNDYTTGCSVSLGATKSVSVGGEKQAPAKGEFSFELLDSNGNVIQTATNDAQGNVAFEPLEYAGPDDGASYAYTIREVAGNGDYVYDDATYTATVELADNGDGTMTCKVTYRRADGTVLAEGTTPAFVNRRTSEVPLTGKGGTDGLLAMGFAVLGGFAAVWVWSKRRRNDGHAPRHMK
jgi:pilin isopeptide linkage protein/uncharacterized repeat protein (TIGR02543 family)